MNILIINSGSSSIKYQLIEMPQEKVVCEGIIERIGIGQENSNFVYKSIYHDEIKIEGAIENHKEGLSLLVSHIFDKKVGVIA